MSFTRKAADAAAIAAFGLGLCLASVDAKADGTNVRVTAPPEINWSGWYVGAHAGWGRWNADRGYPVDEHYVQAGTFLSQSTNGWFRGGQVGFNHQFSRIVVGGELSLSNANIDTRATVQGYPQFSDPPVRLTTKLSNLVTATVRVGATHGPFLFYVKGGVAGGEITAKSWDPPLTGRRRPTGPAAGCSVPASSSSCTATSPGASNTTSWASRPRRSTGRLTSRHRCLLCRPSKTRSSIRISVS